MIKQTIALGFLIPALNAATVKLAWDASISPGVTNYIVYASNNTNNIFLNSRSVGTNLTTSVSGLPSGNWVFSVSAMADGIESDSTSITNSIPVPPANLRIQ